MKKLLPILLLILSCEKDTVAPDTTAPTVAITYPANGSTLTATDTIRVAVTDESEISSVKFLIDGTEAYADSSAPYEYVWDVCVQGTDNHTVLVKAEDIAGNQGQSDVNTYTLNASYDCESVCGGELIEDCEGVCGGDKLLDNCEVCDSDATNDCPADCSGEFGGTAVLSGCDNVCNSTATTDNCGVCDNDATNNCDKDCADVWGGDAVEDECGVCDSDLTNDCTQDCAGVWGGDIVYGSIHGIVTDYNSNALLQGIIVNWVSNGVADFTLTDENGYYSITDLIPGDYNLIFSGEDTTLAVQYAVIEEEGIVENEPSGDCYVEAVKDVGMYSMNGGATGYVYLEVDAEQTIVGASVTVIAEYTQDVKPSQYTATTDATGNYTFSNIPAANNVTFKTVQFTNDTYTFDEASATKDLVPGLTVMVDHITMDQKIASEPVLVSNNFGNNDFQIDDNITGTFNEAIDYSDYNFVMTFSNTSGDYVITWSADNKTFTINPGEDLTLDKEYTINIDGSTIAGREFTESYTFATQKGIEETSSSLESHDDSGNIIGKNDAIQWTFSESLATTKFTFNVHAEGCSNADYSTQSTCLCGDGGAWNPTGGDDNNGECTVGNPTGNQWRWSLQDGNGDENEEDCNVTVMQWNNDAEQNLILCYTATVNSVTNTVTLPAPSLGWGRKQVTDENGVVTMTTYEDITVHYKYVSNLATYDIIEAQYTIDIDE